jgi:hypothetical protein
VIQLKILFSTTLQIAATHSQQEDYDRASHRNHADHCQLHNCFKINICQKIEHRASQKQPSAAKGKKGQITPKLIVQLDLTQTAFRSKLLQPQDY